jgi:hypothetical protein
MSMKWKSNVTLAEIVQRVGKKDVDRKQAPNGRLRIVSGYSGKPGRQAPGD